jgi:hypothetical protein
MPTDIGSSISCSTEGDSLDSTDQSSDDCNIDHVEEIKAQKEYALNYLMGFVHDMFNSPTLGGVRHASTESSTPPKQMGESSRSGSTKPKQKRVLEEETGDADHNDEENNGFRKRRKMHDESTIAGHEKIPKKLACPYYKRHPHKLHSSGACCGPGWESVHRIKYNSSDHTVFMSMLIRSQSPPLSSTCHASSLSTLLLTVRGRVFTDRALAV